MKNKITTIIIIIITLILAGIAIFTAIRLYQLRNQSVSPNVPESKPKAVEVLGTPNPACSLSFTLNQITHIVCSNKTAYKDDSSNTAGHYLLTGNELSATDRVNAEQKIVFAIHAGPPNTVKNIVVTDVVPNYLTFLDSIPECTYTATNKTVTCNLTTTSTPAVFRVTVNTNATGTITNLANVTGQDDQIATCSASVIMATPVPACDNTCTTASDCPTGLTCNIVSGATTGNCRNVSCTGESSCVCPTSTPPPGTPNSCNGTCGSNSNCNSNLVCSNGFCRNPSCVSSSNCACAGGTSTPAPSTPALPQSGTDWPTTVGATLGIFVIIGSMLLAL